jgi:hypothetical protein
VQSVLFRYNRLFALAGDSLDRLKSAANYLEKHLRLPMGSRGIILDLAIR